MVECITRLLWLEGVANTQSTSTPLAGMKEPAPATLRGKQRKVVKAGISIAVYSKNGPYTEAPQTTMYETFAGTQCR